MGELSHIKALAFDLDGTLLRSDKTLSGRTLAALRVCMDRGIRVMLATGRGVEAAERYRREIGSPGPHVYYNGAEVRDAASSSIIYARPLACAPALFCLELARKENHYFQAYFFSTTLHAEVFHGPVPGLDREILLTETPGPYSDYYRDNSGIAPVPGNLEAALSAPGIEGIIKCMFITDESRHEKLRGAVQERFGDTVTLVRSSPVYLEVIAPGVSKGAGLRHALAYTGIEAKDAVAFGDEENDLPMFAAAGFSAAPVNAVENVLAAAAFRIASSEEDGIPAFLEEKVLS